MPDTDKMTEEEIEQLLSKHSHLSEYIQNISRKMKRPEFYHKIPKSKASEEFPNFIYPTKGSVFIHIHRTPDMDEDCTNPLNHFLTMRLRKNMMIC